MKFDLKETAKDHRIIVAHRGVAGGNIPCNTITAYETALKQGADMIEVDVSRTADGHLVIFHPKMEPIQLRCNSYIPNMTLEEVKTLRYVNQDSTPTQFGVVLFDDLMERFKGRCYINIDKFWDCPEDIYREVKRHGMVDQVLVKSGLSDRVVSVLENLAPDVPFIPVVSEKHPRHEELMKRNINYIGAEVLFKQDDSHLASDEFINMMHKDDKLVWINSIIYNHKTQLAGGHSDDTALSESMEKGWGWLADKNYDFIQTDWPIMLINFLKETNRYYR